MPKSDEEMQLVGDEELESDEEDMYTKGHRAASCYEDDVDHVDMEPVELDEDTFGMSVCSLTRDTYYLTKNGCSCARITRLVMSLFLVCVTIFVQCALLGYVKKYVSARAVHDIRISYDKFEEAVYGCDVNPAHCTETINGKHRGIHGNVNINGTYPDFFPGVPAATAILATLTLDVQDAICHIPLSQPKFFSLVLVIWVLTCFTELKKATNLGWILMMLGKTDTMADAVTINDDGEMVIERMTLLMKVVLCVLTFVPRVIITIYLMWVGMRWLLATTAFADLILNAVALEFVLLIKEVIYAAVMPVRSHFDLTKTKIVPHPRNMSAAWFNFTSSICLLFVAVFVVVIYMKYLQAVLPLYNWDVHEVCVEYIKKQYKV